jgi:hypothetical protein
MSFTVFACLCSQIGCTPTTDCTLLDLFCKNLYIKYFTYNSNLCKCPTSKCSASRSHSVYIKSTFCTQWSFEYQMPRSRFWMVLVGCLDVPFIQVRLENWTCFDIFNVELVSVFTWTPYCIILFWLFEKVLHWMAKYRTSMVFQWSISAGTRNPNNRPFKNRTDLSNFLMVHKPRPFYT